MREAGHVRQTLYASTEQEAEDIKARLEMERRSGLFVDYGKARQTTFADLLIRYLKEESPRHKGFEVEGYIINSLLADAGLPKVDIAQAYQDHPNPHPSHAKRKFRRAVGKASSSLHCRPRPRLAGGKPGRIGLNVSWSDTHQIGICEWTSDGDSTWVTLNELVEAICNRNEIPDWFDWNNLKVEVMPGVWVSIGELGAGETRH